MMGKTVIVNIKVQHPESHSGGAREEDSYSRPYTGGVALAAQDTAVEVLWKPSKLGTRCRLATALILGTSTRLALEMGNKLAQKTRKSQK